MRQSKFIALVSPDDDPYRAFCAERAQANLKLRDKLEPSAMMRLSALLERVAQEWLSSVVTLQDERILYAQSARSRGRYQDTYLELDAVETDGDSPVRVFEIKVTSSSTALRKGRAQIERSVALLRQKWLDVRGMVVIVDMLPEGIEELESVPSPLDEGAAMLRDRRLDASDDFLHFSARDLWEWGLAAGHISTSPLWDEAQQESIENESRRRQRRELIDEGVPVEEWPEDLKEQRPELPDAEIKTFADGEEESPMARALRLALGKR